jgi:hypothetical protein
MDAYLQDLITGREAKDRLYQDLKDNARDLSPTAYLALQIEVVNRIKDGRLTLPPNLRAKYPEAYQKSP